MIFENCYEYIVNRFKKICKPETLEGKKIILMGYEAVTKVVAHFLDDLRKTYTIIDCNKYGEYWIDSYIFAPHKILNEIDGEKLIIIINNYDNNVSVLRNFLNIKEEEIINFSGIRMNNIPNNLCFPNGAEPITLKECQDELLELMEDFHEFCERHEIRYYMGSGTLLGAVRHRGFIPWDDDLDIFMPVKDFFKFCNIYKGSEKWQFDSLFNSEISELSVSTLSKIKSKKTFVEYHTFPIRGVDGIGLDIFPICGYPDNNDEAEMFERECRRLEDMWKNKVVIPYGTEEYSAVEHKELFDAMNTLLLKYDYDGSDRVGLGYFGPDLFPSDKTRIMQAEWFLEAELFDFEDKKFYGPKGYDGLLRRLFNDYMELPPIEEQIQRHANGNKGIVRVR